MPGGSSSMASRNVYLKQNVIVEPLYNQWYAWSYLIAPATAAMFTANWHLKLMQSFVNSPQVHIAAMKNPAMLGGPFINYDEKRVPQIRALMDRTGKEKSHLVALAESIKACDDMLRTEATGFSLEQLYARVPERLKGFVELNYDLNNHPSIRFIEALLYRSEYYDESAQSVTLTLSEQDTRQFVFSTPRLPGEECRHLRRPFRDGSYDQLFKMKTVPQPLDHIKEVFGLESREIEKFAPLFTERSPAIPRRQAIEGVRIRYIGHACVLIETESVSILCDPVVSYGDQRDVERVTYADLPETIDYALITHNHSDHCMFETLLQLRHKIKNVIVPKNNGGQLSDPSLKLVLQHLGFQATREIDELETIEIEDGYILGVPFLGEHADLNIRSKTAFLVKLKGKTILLVADSNNLEPQLYKYMHDLTGDIDVLFIGMECDGAPLTWLYGPLLTTSLSRKVDQSRRLDGSNCEKGMKIVNYLKPKQVYVYAMGLEPWLTYLTSIQYTDTSRPILESSKLVEECRRLGSTAERLYCHKEILLN